MPEQTPPQVTEAMTPARAHRREPENGSAEERLRAVLAGVELMERVTRSGSWSWRAPYSEMRWSPGMYRLLGFAEVRVVAAYERLVDAIHLDDKTVFLLRLEEALKKGGPLAIDHRIVLPDGSVRRVHTEARCVLRGTPDEHWIGVMQDRSDAAAWSTALVEALPDAFLLRRLDFGEPIYVSRGYEHLWGHGREELLRHRHLMLDAILPEDLARLGNMLACHRSGCPYEVEYRIRHASGAVRWIRERGHPVRDEQGKVWAMAISATDFTEPKQESAELQESERHFQRLAADHARSGEQYHAYLDNLPALIVWHDAEGRVRQVNRTFERELGWSNAELATMDLLSIAYPDAQRRAEVLDYMRRGGTEWRDFAIRARSGELRNLAWAYVRLGDDSYLGIGIDVHERRNMERRLRESEAKFRSVYESNAVSLMFWRRDGRVVEANDAYLELTGYTREDLAAGAIDRVAVTAPEYRELDERALAEQSAGRLVAVPFEKDLVRKDGTRVRVLAGGAIFPDGMSGVSFAVDRSDNKQAEETLRKLNAELNRTFVELEAGQQRSSRIEKLTALGTLAAGVAHELNNPLMGVMNYVEYALRIVQEPEAGRVLSGAIHELERMRDLLQHMLAFVRPVEEPLTRLSVARAVEGALRLMQSEFDQLHVEVEVDLDPELPPVVAREGVLQQVFINLLMNARDAMAEAAERRIRIRGWQRGDLVGVDVEDTGTGIPPEIEPQIFDPFFTTKPPGRGTGLGLSSAQRVMLEMGGDLIFRCEGEAHGAVFTVLVPRATEA